MWETWVQSLGWEDLLEKEKGYPLQYSGLENSMDSIVQGVAKNRTGLRDSHIVSSMGQKLNKRGQQAGLNSKPVLVYSVQVLLTPVLFSVFLSSACMPSGPWVNFQFYKTAWVFFTVTSFPVHW